jgi:hypothetical protein
MLLMRGEGDDMTTCDDIAQRHIDVWNETDPNARRAAVDKLYTEDPATSIRWRWPRAGRRSSRRSPRQQQFPGLCSDSPARSTATTTRRGLPGKLGPAGEPAAIVGFDITLTDEAGRINTVLGFLDRVPAAA